MLATFFAEFVQFQLFLESFLILLGVVIDASADAALKLD
jgi:hypothetical protein